MTCTMQYNILICYSYLVKSRINNKIIFGRPASFNQALDPLMKYDVTRSATHNGGGNVTPQLSWLRVFLSSYRLVLDITRCRKRRPYLIFFHTFS